MILNKNGKIAYHSLLMKSNGGVIFTQNDYDGKPLNRNLTREEVFVGTIHPHVTYRPGYLSALETIIK